jgi:hypothetical protein
MVPPQISQEGMLKYVDFLLLEFMRLTGMDRDSTEVEQVKSGLAKMINFQDANAFISEKANKLEEFEKQLWHYTLKQDGIITDPDVQYPNAFHVQNDMSRANFYEKMLSLFSNQAAIKAFIQEQALELLSDVPSDLRVEEKDLVLPVQIVQPADQNESGEIGDEESENIVDEN